MSGGSKEGILNLMTRTLVIANQKGGIGKSTTAANIGRALTERGFQVLLIDLDPQGGLSAALGVDSYDVQFGSHIFLLHDSAPIYRVTQQVSDNLFLMPASLHLTVAEIQLARRTDAIIRLRDALQRQPSPADFIIMDTPPTLGILTANGLVAADELIIPVQCQYLAMRGVRTMMQAMQRLQKNVNPSLRLLGVLATLYQAESLHSQEALGEMRSVFKHKMFETILAYDDIMAEAPVAGKSIIDYAPTHPAAHAYRALATEIINRGN